MNVVSSSSSRTSRRCVLVVVSTHSVCTRGRSSAACGCPVGARAGETRQHRRQSLLGGWQPFRDRGLQVDVRKQPVDGCAATWVRISSFSIMLPRDRLEPARRGRCASRRTRACRPERAGSARTVNARAPITRTRDGLPGSESGVTLATTSSIHGDQASVRHPDGMKWAPAGRRASEVHGVTITLMDSRSSIAR